MMALVLSPYRCVDCGNRFFKLSHGFGAMLALMTVIGFIVAGILTAVYILTSNGIAPPPAAAPKSKPAVAATPAGKSVSAQSLAPYAKAAAGDAQSQFDLAMLYLNGEGGAPKNYGEALKWLEQAAKGGHADARFSLAMMYKTGQGALQNFEQAFHWFEMAAGQNHAEAQFNIALMHKLGLGIPVDYVKSYTWSNIAAVQGHLGAINLRDNLLGAMTPQQIAEGQRASREWKVSDEKPKQVASPPTKG